MSRTKWPPLSVTHPEIAGEWDASANGDKTPEDVTLASKFLAHWHCQSGHDEVQRVDHRVAYKGCSACKTDKLLKEKNLALTYPDLARQWHPTKNGDVTPDLVTFSGTAKAWWQCDKYEEHVWEALIRNRAFNGATCPFCSSALPHRTNSLATHYPEVAKQWHPEKNGQLTPDMVTSKSNRLVWWQCERGHTWMAMVEDRTLYGKGCPFCSNFYVTDENRLTIRYPEIAAEFHPTKNRRLWPKEVGSFKAVTNSRMAPKDRLDYKTKRRLLPSDLSFGSWEDVWWQCKKSAEHVWRDTVFNRACQGAGCPFCSGRLVCSDNNLAELYPALAKQWHSRNGSLLPTQVTPRSNKEVWWRCFRNAHHAWQAPVIEVVKAYDAGKTACVKCRAEGYRGHANGKKQRA